MVLEDIKDLEKIDITKLEPGNHMYVVQIHIEDMPREQVVLHLQRLSTLFKDRGITNAVFIPISPQGIKELSIKELKNDN